MFRDFIFMKNDLDIICSENKVKGIFYKKKYLTQIQKLLNNLKNNPVDVKLLKGFYGFLKLTRINLDNKFREEYEVSLYSDLNSIKIIVSSDINFTISVFMESKITVTYCNSNNRFVYDIIDNLSNIDNRDREKYKIISEVSEKITDIIIFSVMSYFKKGK